jgi:hypothetical protein
MKRSKRSRAYVVNPEEKVREHESKIAELEKLVAELSVASPARSDQSKKNRGKLIAQEKIDDLVRRLSDPKSELSLPEKPAASSRPPLGPEEVEGLVERLGVVDVETRKQRFEELMSAEAAALPLNRILESKGEDALRKLDVETQEMSVTRLCAEAIQRKREAIEKIRQKQVVPHVQKVCTKDEILEATRRVYDESLQKKRKELQLLREKYVRNLSEPMKLTAATQVACADRLSKK